MKSLLFSATAVLFLSACTTSDPKNDDAVAAKDKLICRTERAIGCSFSKRVCRSREEIEQARRDSEEVLDRIRLNTNTGGGQSQ